MSADQPGFADLVRRVREGETGARAELFERYGRFVRLAVRRRLPDRLRVEYDSLDFAQDVWASFLALPPERLEFPTAAALAGFLTRVAHNKVIDEVRRRFATQAHDLNRQTSLPDPADPTGGFPSARDPSPSQWVIAEEKLKDIADKLGPDARTVAERLQDGMTRPEIAASLGKSLRSIERTVSQLQAYLKWAGK